MSTESPTIPSNYFQEQEGILAVQAAAFSLRSVWRPTPNADLGIDGQLELIAESGETTGKIVAVQIKSGDSYVKNNDGHDIVYYPGDKHRSYWANFPIPVILAIHDPKARRVNWVDARSYLRHRADSKAIKVPLLQVLNASSRTALFETCGAFDSPMLPTEELGKRMASERTSNPNFNPSFIELFCFGLTDIGRKLFFNMDLYQQLTEAKGSILGGEDELVITGPSQEEYDFIDRYVRFLVSQNIVYYDFYDYLIDWNERQVAPVFLCPLTRRGHAVLEQVRQAKNNGVRLQEYPVRMAFGYSHLSYDPLLPFLLKSFSSITEQMRR